MQFKDKLNQLMEQFHISNSKLAKEINIDPSLVSRWRNGDRVPTMRSSHIPSIADYFLSQNGYSYQQEYLRHILEEQKAELPNISDQVALLSDWLIRDTASSTVIRPFVSSEEYAEVLLQQIQGLAKDRPAQAAMPSLDFPLPTLTTQYKKDFHLFAGNSAKRKAVIYLLTSVLRSEEKTELFLLSDEDMSWLTEDRVFQVQWHVLLRGIIEAGHKISIIHTVHRDTHDILQAINLWMPLHLLGSIKSYYNPRYQSQIVKTSWFVQKDMRALVSSSVTFEDVENLSYLYELPEVAQSFQSQFMGRLTGCKPLFEIFKKTQQFELLDRMIQNIAVVSPTTSWHLHVNSIFLPDDVYTRYSKTLPPTAQKNYIDKVRQLRTRMLNSLSIAPYTDIFPLQVLKDSITRGAYVHFDPVFFLRDEIICTRLEIKAIIENMIFVIENNEKFQLFFGNYHHSENEITININLKENTEAFLTANVQGLIPLLGFYVHEGNILSSMNHYMEEVINHIPTMRRSRPDVLKELYKMLESI
ncbi:MAG: helix-turn-helix transcriptional regulator [Erysipelotrichaceae bacterium]|nr:helix-turn-helix transcriptional regulator [Erysipelotrichaceae bacterium]